MGTWSIPIQTITTLHASQCLFNLVKSSLASHNSIHLVKTAEKLLKGFELYIRMKKRSVTM